jgi:hypothetical protein
MNAVPPAPAPTPEPLPTPDRKPHVPPQAPGTECCHCCEGVAAATPQELANRQGLSAVAYRIGDHAQFRASLHALLSSAAYPALDALRTRDDDDFTIGLVDAFACAADVLTFYQERIANESYLRTALERVSLQEMGKLIGYRLRPGVAAETWLAFALETPPAPPPNLKPEPGAFVTGVPAAVTLDAGLKVQSVPGPGEQPQVFETVEPLEARPAWNAMRPWMSEPDKLARGHTGAWLAGLRTNLQPGDAILIVGDEFDHDATRTSNRWDFRILDSVTPDDANERTLVAWSRGLGSMTPYLDPPASNPRLYALRKRAAVFGHNAPMWLSMSDSFRDTYPGGSYDETVVKEWPDYQLAPADAGDGCVDLDSVVAGAVPGGYAVLATGGFNYPVEPAPPDTYVELYAIGGAAEVSRAQFALSGKVTRLRLNGANYGPFKDLVRQTTVFVQSDLLAPAEAPATGPVSGTRVPVAAGADGLLPGRRLVVRGKRMADGAAVAVQATLVAITVVDATRCYLEIDPPLPGPLRRDSVVVHANVALASHGETVAQVLGAGDAAQAFQRFDLKQAPLTYRAAANEIGARAELTVRVAGIEWRERATMFGAAPTERAYTLANDEQGRTFVVFGDGVRGARLPSGANNVSASYRKGLGVAGNVAVDKLTQLMSRPLGLKSVSNPAAAEGGADPEDAQAARRSMPLGTRTLGRAVSVLDYEDFARAFSGVAKAQVQVLQLPHGRVVAITLAGPGGARLTVDSPVWSHLQQALRTSGDPHVSVQLLPASIVPFKLGLKVKPDPDYEPTTVLAAVEAALRAAFSFDAREFAAAVQQSAVVAVAQAVPGVVAVDVTRLNRGAAPLRQQRLLAARMRVESGSAQGAELLVLDSGPLDQLELMP